MKKDERKLLEKINNLNIEKKPIDLNKIEIEPTNEPKQKSFNFKFLVPLGISFVLIMMFMSINLQKTGENKADGGTSSITPPSDVEPTPGEVPSNSLEDYFNHYGSYGEVTSSSDLIEKTTNEFIKIFNLASSEESSSDSVTNKEQYQLFITALKEGIEEGVITVEDLNLVDVDLSDSLPENPSYDSSSSKPNVNLNNVKYNFMLGVIEDYLE